MEKSNNIETKFVHEVYDIIAPHFNHTRYKPWPIVEKFLKEQSENIIADIGCGNGKYLGVAKNCFSIGGDRCAPLISICKNLGFESLICDNISIPFRNGFFDTVISIAVIHHLSTEERRLKAIQELFRILRIGGRLLVTVWALEQKGRQYSEQDVFVPWHLQPTYVPSSTIALDHPAKDKQDEDNFVFKRYYHLFKEGELYGLVQQIKGVKIIECAYDHDNWYLFAEKTD